MYYLIAIIVFLLNIVFGIKKQPPRYWYNETEKKDSLYFNTHLIHYDSLKTIIYDIQN